MKQKTKKLFIHLSLFLVVGFCLYQVQTKVLAEQSGSSPESGVTSRIKAIYDSLVSLSHGSESAGGWGNWGVMWNRIRSAAEWVPTGDATDADVATGKIFFSQDRIQKTGNASLAPNWRVFSNTIWDDYKNGANTDGDNADEESLWSNTSGNATSGVWKDNRTALYWSANQGSYTNSAAVSICDFYSSTPRGSYTGGDSDCGNAINTCANLSLDATGDAVPETDWYLPSQKDILLAYIDGITNNTNGTFVSLGTYFWSSTENADFSTAAWYTRMANGDTYYDNKTASYAVRCVRRD